MFINKEHGISVCLPLLFHSTENKNFVPTLERQPLCNERIPMFKPNMLIHRYTSPLAIKANFSPAPEGTKQ
jgi:hypothetical protein